MGLTFRYTCYRRTKRQQDIMGALGGIAIRCSLVLLTLQAGRRFARAYNIDKLHHKVVSGPNASYFGYSVALWADYNGDHRLAIGAPKGTVAPDDTLTSSNEYNGTYPFGNLYLCHPMGNTTQDACVVRTDVPGLKYKDGKLHTLKWGKESLSKQGIGFGETVFARDKNSSNLVVCAPRYAYKLVSDYKDVPGLQPRGACFIIYRASGGSPQIVFPYENVDLKNDAQNKVIQKANEIDGTGFAETGFSSFMSEDGNRLYLGGPFGFYAQGVVVQMERGRKWRRKKTSQVRYLNDTAEVMDNSYTGWAVVSGKLCPGQECVAASSLGYDNHKGKVTIYAADLKKKIKHIRGSEHGIGYGFSLAIGDFNGDGRDDLAVGAPFANKEAASYLQDTGKVFIYFAPSENDTGLILEGRLPWGRFGHSVTSPGDLDSDGYADLVIGAPFTYDGKGSVYIYNGDAKGIHKKPSQVIHASEFLPFSLSWFGYSLDGGLDFDGNGYPDLVVGAPNSHNAVFLRTGPVITLEGTIAFDSPMVYLNDTSCPVNLANGIHQNVVCFDLTINIQYQAKHLSEPLLFRLKVDLDHHYKRLAFVDSHKEEYSSVHNITHVGNEMIPLKFLVYVKPNIRHLWLSEMAEANLKVSFSDKQNSTLDLLSVMSAYSKTTFTNSTEFHCPPPKNCLTSSDLILMAEEEPIPLVISDGLMSINLSVEVRNNSAYAVNLNVTLPNALKFWQIQSDSFYPELRGQYEDESSTVLDFIFASEIPKGEKVKLTFTFIHSSADFLKYGEENLSFGFVIRGDTPDLNSSNNEHIIKVPLKSKVEMSARGWSTPDMVEAKLNESLPGKSFISHNESQEANLTGIMVNQLGPKITHHYILLNHGPSPLYHGQIVIGLPLALPLTTNIKTGEMKDFPILYVANPLETTSNIQCSPMLLNPLNLTTTLDDLENGTVEYNNTLTTAAFTEDPLEWNNSSFDNRTTDEGEEVNDQEEENETTQYINKTKAKRSPHVSENYPEADRIVRESSKTTESPVTKNPTSGSGARKRSPLELKCGIVPCEEIVCDISELAPGGDVTIEVTGYVVVGTLEIIHRYEAFIESGMAFYTTQKNVYLNKHIASNEGAPLIELSMDGDDNDNEDYYETDIINNTSINDTNKLSTIDSLLAEDYSYADGLVLNSSSAVTNIFTTDHSEDENNDKNDSTNNVDHNNTSKLNTIDSFSTEGYKHTDDLGINSTNTVTKIFSTEHPEDEDGFTNNADINDTSKLSTIDSFLTEGFDFTSELLQNSTTAITNILTTERNGDFTEPAENTKKSVADDDNSTTNLWKPDETEDTAETAELTETSTDLGINSTNTVTKIFSTEHPKDEDGFTNNADINDTSKLSTIDSFLTEGFDFTSELLQNSTTAITNILTTERNGDFTEPAENTRKSVADDDNSTTNLWKPDETEDTAETAELTETSTVETTLYEDPLKEESLMTSYDTSLSPGEHKSSLQTTAPTTATKPRTKTTINHRKYDVTVSSYITVIKKSKEYEFSIKSVYELRGLEIIGAVTGGLMGIIVLCSLLHMCGFFKRKRISKEQREELERTIKERQEREKYA